MARRRSRRSEQRDHNTIANTFHVLRAPTVYSRPRASILSYNDRREFHPDYLFRPVYSRRMDDRVVTDVNVNKPFPSKPYKSVFGFASPSKVDLCVRRKQRKEVLFAKRKTGKGARAPKRFNFWSNVRC